MKKIWPWLGDQKNHNALMFIMTFIAVIVALPYFSNQINNVEIKVDSIETSLKEIYGRQMRETFTYSQIK